VQFSWHGCIDHLLNLITKIAFKDFAESDGAMNATRELVGHFSSSSPRCHYLLLVNLFNVQASYASETLLLSNGS
jgi:hypothetical protein